MVSQGRETHITEVWSGGYYVDTWGVIFCPRGLGWCGLKTLCPRAVAKSTASNPEGAAVKGPWAHLKNNKRLTTPFLSRTDLSETRLEEGSPGVLVTFKGKSLNVK